MAEGTESAGYSDDGETLRHVATPDPFLPWLQQELKSAAIRFGAGVATYLFLEQGAGAVKRVVRAGHRRRPVLSSAWGSVDPSNLPSALRQLLLNRKAIRLGGWAASCGLAYASVKRWSGSSAAAGVAAGATVAMLGPLRGTIADPVEFALHSAVRAAEQVLREAGSDGMLPPALAEHGSVLVFVAACTQIMFCWFYQPDALPRSYRTWITRMADMDSRLITALQQLRSGRVRYGKASPILRDYCRDHFLDPRRADLVHGHIPCSIVHPACGEGCLHNCLSRAAGGMLASLLLYVPVHAAGAALRTGRTLSALSAAGAPPSRLAAVLLDAVNRIAYGSVRSSAFLGLFIGLVWYGVCLTRNAFRSDLTLGPLFGSFLCGWTILLEQPRRHADLAMFVLPRALHAAWFSLKRSMPLHDVPLFHVVLAAVSGGILIPAWERETTDCSSTSSASSSSSFLLSLPSAASAPRASGADNVSGALAPAKPGRSGIQPLVSLVLWLLLGSARGQRAPSRQ